MLRISIAVYFNNPYTRSKRVKELGEIYVLFLLITGNEKDIGENKWREY